MQFPLVKDCGVKDFADIIELRSKILKITSGWLSQHISPGVDDYDLIPSQRIIQCRSVLSG
jgi:hypothetical protein